MRLNCISLSDIRLWHNTLLECRTNSLFASLKAPGVGGGNGRWVIWAVSEHVQALGTKGQDGVPAIAARFVDDVVLNLLDDFQKDS